MQSGKMHRQVHTLSCCCMRCSCAAYASCFACRAAAASACLSACATVTSAAPCRPLPPGHHKPGAERRGKAYKQGEPHAPLTCQGQEHYVKLTSMSKKARLRLSSPLMSVRFPLCSSCSVKTCGLTCAYHELPRQHKCFAFLLFWQQHARDLFMHGRSVLAMLAMA